MCPSFSEVFKPARMKTEEKWNPAKQNPGFQPPAIDTSKPKAKFRDIGDIMHTGTSKHTSYHIPPGKRIVIKLSFFSVLCY